MERLSIQEIIDHCERQLKREPVGSIFYREHEAVKAYLMELLRFRDTGMEPEQRRWISVEERLPNREDADSKGLIIAVDRESNKTKLWWFDIVAKYPQEFTHWMPLPELPKED